MILPSSFGSLFWKGTHVGLSAAVERGPSQGARSGSTGPTWAPFQFFFFVRPLRAQETDQATLTHLVTRARSLYNPAPAARWTDRTTQPCEHTDFSPLTNPLAHPRLAVSHQRRHLYRPRQYLRDRAADDAGLWDEPIKRWDRKRGQAKLAQYAEHRAGSDVD